MNEARRTTIHNLRKLADYIEAEVPQEKLDMRAFRKTSDGDFAFFENHTKCGTSGCALGWAPFVEGLEPVEDDFSVNPLFSRSALNWDEYSQRILPDPLIDCRAEDDGHWSSVFSGHLSSYKADVVGRLRAKADEFEAMA